MPTTSQIQSVTYQDNNFTATSTSQSQSTFVDQEHNNFAAASICHSQSTIFDQANSSFVIPSTSQRQPTIFDPENNSFATSSISKGQSTISHHDHEKNIFSTPNLSQKQPTIFSKESNSFPARRVSENQSTTLDQESFAAVTEKALPKNEKAVRGSWTSKHKSIMLKYFTNHIKNKIAPKKADCLQFKENFKELFKHKTWVQIKVFIYNTYKQL